MITDVMTLEKMLKGSNPKARGLVFYRGPSALDGAPIIGIVNRLAEGSQNSKTGRQVQTFIIREDVHPLEAVKSGADVSICGDCMHRMQDDGSRSCYVDVAKSVASVYGAYHRGRYLMPHEYDVGLLTPLLKGKALRCGAYGDPSAIPFQHWALMVNGARKTTGYTHQWKKPMFAAFKSFCMASVDSELEATAARAMGWRTFRVGVDAETMDDEIACPSLEGVKCADCALCSGLKTLGKNIVIPAHGVGAKAFIRKAAA